MPEGEHMVQSVLIADPSPGSRDNLARDLANLGIEVFVAHDIDAVAEVVTSRKPDAVVTELKLRDGTWRDAVMRVRAPSGEPPKVVILTSYGSIASAIAATKAGVARYLTKPVSAARLVREIEGEREPDGQTDADGPTDVSLDRAIWEILSQALESAGTISGAARRLGLHRRSLRRMLQKHPPRW